MSIALPGAALLSLLLIFLRWHYVGLIISLLRMLLADPAVVPPAWVFVPLAGLLIIGISSRRIFELSLERRP